MKNCSHWIVSAIFISNYSYSSAINLEPTEINQKWRVVVDPQTCWGFVLNQLKSFNISSFGTPRVNHQSKLSIYMHILNIYTPFSNATKTSSPSYTYIPHYIRDISQLKSMFFLQLQWANWKSMKYWLNKCWWESKYAMFSDRPFNLPSAKQTLYQ